MVTAAAVTAIAGWCAGVADAHAELVRSTPANGQILDASPPQILLEFSEPVDPIGPAIRIVDAQGAAVELGEVDQDSGRSTLQAAIPDVLDDGTYVVAWQAVSADSHRIRGAFTFSVGEETATAPGVVEDLFDAEPDGAADSLLLGVGRWLAFAGIGLFVGLTALAALLAPEVVGSLRGQIVLVCALAAAAVGTVVMVATQAHLIAGSPWAWVDVFETRAGQWWMTRFLVLAVLAVLLMAWTRLGRLPAPLVIAVGAGSMAVVAAGGHGISGDSVTAGFVATVFHLSAMACWIGGLALIAMASRGTRFRTASSVSPFALGAVVTLAATGALNAWRQLDGFGSIGESAYGRWLVVKLVLVVGVVAVAAFSRRTVRRGTTSTAGTDTANDDDPEADRDTDTDDDRRRGGVLGRSVVVELAGMALVLAATAGLVNSTPPEPAPEIASASAVVGERIAQVELDPAVTGGTEMHVYLTSPSGGLDRAEDISVTAELEGAGIGPLELETQPAGANHVIGTNVDLPIAGEWTFVVKARFGEFEQVTFTMQLPVTD